MTFCPRTATRRHRACAASTSQRGHGVYRRTDEPRLGPRLGKQGTATAVIGRRGNGPRRQRGLRNVTSHQLATICPGKLNKGRGSPRFVAMRPEGRARGEKTLFAHVLSDHLLRYSVHTLLPSLPFPNLRQINHWLAPFLAATLMTLLLPLLRIYLSNTSHGQLQLLGPSRRRDTAAAGA